MSVSTRGTTPSCGKAACEAARERRDCRLVDATAAESPEAARGVATQRLLVVNQYYAPDYAATGQIAAELCASLADKGMHVRVVAGEPSYTEAALHAPAFEVLDGVEVHRVGMGGSRGRERLRVRLTGFLRFFFGGWRLARSLSKSEHPDVVATFGNPPIISLAVALLARRSRSRFVYILHDIHPDILRASGFKMLPRPVLWAFDLVHRWVLKQADFIVVLGDGMKRTLVERKGVREGRVRVIPLWARPELDATPVNSSVRRELGVKDADLLLLYAGNMGVMHPLDDVLDAAVSCRGLKVHFLLIGDGARRAALVARVEEEGVAQVSFLPYQSESRFAEIMATSDASLVVLKPGLEGLAVPSKAYTSMGAGKPLISLMRPEADVAKMVAEDDCGWNVTSADGLTELLRGLVGRRDELVRRGRNGRRAYAEKYTRERAVAEYMEVLASG